MQVLTKHGLLHFVVEWKYLKGNQRHLLPVSLCDANMLKPDRRAKKQNQKTVLSEMVHCNWGRLNDLLLLLILVRW